MWDNGWCRHETRAGVSEKVVKTLYSHMIIAEESYKVSVNNLLWKVVKLKIKSLPDG